MGFDGNGVLGISVCRVSNQPIKRFDKLENMSTTV